MFPIDIEAKERDLAWGREFAKAQKWREAKTYAKTTPHEYIVVHEDDSRREDFRKMFELLEKYGKEETFFGKRWLYLYLGDGYKYFSADGGGWENDRYVLNRAEESRSY